MIGAATKGCDHARTDAAGGRGPASPSRDFNVYSRCDRPVGVQQLAAQAQPSPGWRVDRGSAGHSARRLDARARSAQALNAGAGIIRSFIEDYHEHLEEQYVFPKLEQAAKLSDITTVLRTQHQRGRVLTDWLLAATTGAAATDQPARDALVQNMSAFIRMYEPHEAREDTVVFPALRTCCPPRSFAT